MGPLPACPIFSPAFGLPQAKPARNKAARANREAAKGAVASDPISEVTVGGEASNMRLSQVEYAPKQDASGILSFYMGKNTPERKDYIMENLVVPVEE